MSPDPRLPEPADLPEPLYEVWAGSVRIQRCHDSRFGATEFNPGLGRGRFHPFARPDGGRVSVLYGSDTKDGALAETVFHAVPARGAQKTVRRSSLRPMLLSALTVHRDLRLIQLHGYGLRRLGITRAQLIDSEADAYPVTTRWASALHALCVDADGLVWISRQHDTSRSLVLFGDRVDRASLSIDEVPLPLALGAGFEMVQAAAEKAGITILE